MELIVSVAPHQRSKISIHWAMRQVIIALIPAILASLILFREKALFLILNCSLSCLLTEEIILKIKRKPSQAKNCSAILTGILLALVLPPSTKWYAATLGSIFAIFIGKQVFGGLGQNIFNPALIGRAFLAAAYPKMMTTWINPFTLDAITRATPLALRKFDQILTPLKDLFIGTVPGSLGETSALALIIGGIYLLIRKVIDWRIPLTLLVTTVIISSIFYFLEPLNGSPLFHIFSGGFLLGAFFMATDPVTTPVTKKGRYIFGVGCGILIMVIRYFSGLPEGVMYSIIFMNALVPLINRYTIPKPFGYER
ncbi:MAG: electron transporter RnfD [Candidatus Omnitrophota bacterium]|nr:MAG: electron transporter RnfD [Candidatus Omnitrophota bacterium]RKY45333.1 MAG: electron transporter RnfD [Candidatus Omnitrophota bacterium]